MQLKEFLCCCSLLCISLSANATKNHMVVTFKEGGHYDFLLEEKPTITFDDDHLIVNENASTTYELDNVDGWYFCDGREMPKEYIGNKTVEEVVNTYGTPRSMRLPDMRPERYAIYLGYPNTSPLREDGKKQYRPYESSAEMIVDFIDRFKVNCPSYCEPLVWVKGKENDNRFLVTGFSLEGGVCLGRAAYISFNTLFNWYTYLDGSPVGMEEKE